MSIPTTGEKEEKIEVNPDMFKDLTFEVNIKPSELSEKKYFVGIDTAIRPKWWQKILVWFGLIKNKWDYSCAVVFRKNDDGTYELMDRHYF